MRDALIELGLKQKKLNRLYSIAASLNCTLFPIQ